MKANDRVQIQDEMLGRRVYGTVTRVTPAGYVFVHWDDGFFGHFSPEMAKARLELDGEARNALSTTEDTH